MQGITTLSIDRFSQESCPGKDSCSLLQEALRQKAKAVAENEKLIEIFQFATLEFEKKNEKIALLKERLQETNATIKELRKENEELQKKVKKIEGKNSLLNKMVFSRKSEKKEREEFPAGEEIKKRGAKKNHTGHGRNIPENLPVIEEIRDLPDNEKFCIRCRKPYIETGLEEVSREVTVERKYYLKKIKRKVYKKTCHCPNPLITAPPPPKLIPRGKFSIEFWVDVLINKYRNHLPVERQVSEMKEYGLPVSTGTIFGGFKKILLHLQPLYEAMERSLREASHWHADESGWRVFVKINDKENYKWFMWIFASKDIVLFVLAPTRSAEVPCKTLFDIEIEEAEMLDKPIVNSKKIMSVDKFSSYKMLRRLGFVELSFCWTHQRRKFIESKTKYPEIASWAQKWVERIAQLYRINNKRVKYNPEDSLFKKYDKKLRKKINKIYYLINIEHDHPEKNSIMNSMKEHWKGLILFVDEPEIPMDNNLAERMLRPMVVGRKNHWGNHSTWAGKLTCVMYSLVQTCLLHGVSPRAYLTYYLTECARRGSAPPEDEIETFLPHKLNEETRKKLTIASPDLRAPP